MTIRLLVFDFGGTKLATARIDVRRGRADLAALHQAATPDNATASRDLSWRMATEVYRDTIDAVGVSFGGPVDGAGATVQVSHHVGGWDNYPLRQEVADRYGVPCALLNDANAGALGEQRWGAGRGMSNLLYVTVGTGVGAGLVLRGQVHTGARGLAGELGHLVVADDGPTCSCGRRGCVEAFASGPAIARAARHGLDHGRQASLLRTAAGGNTAAVDARMVAEAARGGDELALSLLARAGRALGRGLAAAVVLYDPQAIVLGGSIVKSGPPLLDPARAALRERALGPPPEILMAKLGDAAPLYGAAAAAVDLITDGST
jgi:glucokinase